MAVRIQKITLKSGRELTYPGVCRGNVAAVTKKFATAKPALTEAEIAEIVAMKSSKGGKGKGKRGAVDAMQDAAWAALTYQQIEAGIEKGKSFLPIKRADEIKRLEQAAAEAKTAVDEAVKALAELKKQAK